MATHPAARRLACLSVDLDEIHEYRAIHGIGREGLGAAAGLVYQRALDRFAAFADEFGVPLTFFVVGRDATQRDNAERLRRLGRAGHELGNHSLDHRYDLSRLHEDEQRRQVIEGERMIAEASGAPVLGFRAPGYVLSERLVRVLTAAGVVYDSSVFPCPGYQLAKLAALLVQRLGGRFSESILDSPRVLVAPSVPYRLGQPYHRRGQGLIEFPIQVTPRLRLPYIGTSLTLGGPVLARYLTRALSRQTFVNLELHGIDLLDTGDGLQALGRVQPDLRLAWPKKRATLGQVVRTLTAAGFEFTTLGAAARELDP